MSSETGSDPARRARFAAAYDEYVHAADTGTRPDLETFLSRFPDLRPELDDLLSAYAALEGLIAPSRPEPESTVPAETIAHTPHQDPGLTTDHHGDHTTLPRATTVRYFGDYEIQRELGRGGMGVVYQARQVSLNRPVALKMLKAGLFADSDDLRRFQNEAEAVALLDHPGIVPVYEVGEHEGQRYFSMKLIEGTSLVPLLPALKQNPRAAARLVADAAEAIAHAHARGILHRDLKPANILLSGLPPSSLPPPPGEGRGEGASSRPLDLHQATPHITDFGLAKRLEVDEELTATGAILGTPAYMSPEQASGHRGTITTATDVYGLGAVLYALLTGQAPFKGDSIVDTLTKVKEQPPEPPTRLNTQTPRDLETICLKCLEKDPRRRYTTAQSLSDDLRAWLDNRPITARRVGVPERAWLWCKRKPAIAALTAATALALILGTGSVIAVQAKANHDLSIQFAATKKAELLADKRLNSAMQAIKDYYTGFSEDALTGEQVPQYLRERLLAKPLQFYEDLTRQLAAKSDVSLREGVLLAEGRLSLARILAILGRLDEARRQGVAAVTLYETLLATQPNSLEFQDGLAASYDNLGLDLQAMGEQATAREANGKAIRLREALVAAQPSVPEYQDGLAKNYNNLGLALLAAGDLPGAREAFDKAINVYAALVAAQPGVPAYQDGLAGSYMNLGVNLHTYGDPNGAQEAFNKAIALGETLVAAQPGVPAYQDGLARSYTCMGSELHEAGISAGAREAFGKAIALGETLVAAQPGVPDYQDGLATSHTNLGVIMRAAGELAGAREAFGKAIKLREALVAARPGVPAYQRGLAVSYTNLGIVLLDEGDPAAREANGKAITRFEALVAAQPGVPEYQNGLAGSYMNMGNVLQIAGESTGAREAYIKSITLREALVAAEPGVPEYQNGLAMSHVNLGELLRASGEAAEALAAFRRAVECAVPDTPVAFALPGLIRQTQAELAATQRLDIVVRGEETPQDTAEQLTFAQICYKRGYHAAAARLWGEALERDPKVGEDRQAQHRYNAACAAVLAGCGNSKDDPPPDEAAKAALRNQARRWLEAEVEAWSKLLEKAGKPNPMGRLFGAPDRDGIRKTLDHWTTDPDLNGVRGAAIETLPEPERAPWLALWANVEALRTRAAGAELPADPFAR